MELPTAVVEQKRKQEKNSHTTLFSQNSCLSCHPPIKKALFIANTEVDIGGGKETKINFHKK